MIQRHDVQHLQVLPLVFVNSLDENIEHRFRIRDDAGALDGEGGKRSLVVLLDGVPAIAELGVVGERFEPPQLGEILDPLVADMFGDELRKFRIAEHHPAARRHTVRLVAEFLRPHFIEVLEDVAFQQLGVQLGHPVDGMAADTGQMGHANIALARLVDQ